MHKKFVKETPFGLSLLLTALATFLAAIASLWFLIPILALAFAGSTGYLPKMKKQKNTKVFRAYHHKGPMGVNRNKIIWKTVIYKIYLSPELFLNFLEKNLKGVNSTYYDIR